MSLPKWKLATIPHDVSQFFEAHQSITMPFEKPEAHAGLVGAAEIPVIARWRPRQDVRPEVFLTRVQEHLVSFQPRIQRKALADIDRMGLGE